jgi:hypothetical protein
MASTAFERLLDRQRLRMLESARRLETVTRLSGVTARQNTARENPSLFAKSR